MYYNDNEDDLVFYNETEEEPETTEAETDETDETESTRSTSNPFISDAELGALLDDDANDPDAVRRRKEQRAQDRAWRHKTGRKTGVFGLDLLTMLTVSPFQFKKGWKTFFEFHHLGQYRPDKDGNMPDPAECDQLYQDKKNVFQACILSEKFLKSAIIDAVAFTAAAAGLIFGLSWLSAKFGPFKLIWVIITLEIAWNLLKSFLRSLLSAMSATHDNVLAKKEKTDIAKKAKKAQREAEEKARQKARRQQHPAPTDEDQSDDEPIRPMGRGRYRRSGG